MGNSPIQKSETNGRCYRIQLWFDYIPDAFGIALDYICMAAFGTTDSDTIIEKFGVDEAYKPSTAITVSDWGFSGQAVPGPHSDDRHSPGVCLDHSRPGRHRGFGAATADGLEGCAVFYGDDGTGGRHWNLDGFHNQINQYKCILK